jgi:hypothetical protein
MLLCCHGPATSSIQVPIYKYDAIKTCAMDSMLLAANEEITETGKGTGVAGSFDGSWQNKGARVKKWFGAMHWN